MGAVKVAIAEAEAAFAADVEQLEVELKTELDAVYERHADKSDGLVDKHARSVFAKLTS
jgi:hypothetical protein